MDYLEGIAIYGYPDNKNRILRPEKQTTKPLLLRPISTSRPNNETG